MVADDLDRERSDAVGDYLNSSQGQRWDTEGLVVESLRRHHPDHHISITPTYTANLIAFATASDEVCFLSPFLDFAVFYSRVI